MGRRRDLLAAFVTALRDEAEVQRRSGGHPIDVRDGRRVDASAEGVTYRFTLHADVFLPDGAPVSLEIDGRRSEAEVLNRQGDVLLLYLPWPADEDPPPETIDHATLRAEPWLLTTALAERLDNVDDELEIVGRLLDLCVESGDATPSAARSATRSATGPKEARRPPWAEDENEGPGTQTARQRPPATTAQPPGDPREANPWQEAAIEACRRDPIHFVWGPPGTGKTRTLGELVARLAAAGETLLVTAHANVAVDAALLAAARATGLDQPEVLRPTGAPSIVRAGPPALAEARALGITVEELALRRRPDLNERLRTLTAELARLREGGQRPSSTSTSRAPTGPGDASTAGLGGSGGSPGAARAADRSSAAREAGRSAEIRRELRAIRAELRDEERAVLASAREPLPAPSSRWVAAAEDATVEASMGPRPSGRGNGAMWRESRCDHHAPARRSRDEPEKLRHEGPHEAALLSMCNGPLRTPPRGHRSTEALAARSEAILYDPVALA